MVHNAGQHLRPPAAHAGGCKYASDSRTVPEREQRAQVERADGIQTLYVAARSDPTAGGAGWVVPVRSDPAGVTAEQVDAFPTITRYRTRAKAAERQLQQAVAVAGVLDSGGLCCPIFFDGCGMAAAPSDAAEVAPVERPGMVVTVVSAASQAGLERCLGAQGVDRATADLSPLAPYLGRPGYALGCGWAGVRGEPVTATGLRVTFPRPTVWFPLRPTRAYTDPVETVFTPAGS